MAGQKAEAISHIAPQGMIFGPRTQLQRANVHCCRVLKRCLFLPFLQDLGPACERLMAAASLWPAHQHSVYLVSRRWLSLELGPDMWARVGVPSGWRCMGCPRVCQGQSRCARGLSSLGALSGRCVWVLLAITAAVYPWRFGPNTCTGPSVTAGQGGWTVDTQLQ
jgi:hypothetical protein